MSVILLSSDLVAVSRVSGAAAQAGAVVRTVSNADEAAECCVAESAAMLIIDLALPSLDIGALVQRLRGGANVAKIVAYGPHVYAERLAAARQAGCDKVVSRGQFFAQLDAILRH